MIKELFEHISDKLYSCYDFEKVFCRAELMQTKDSKSEPVYFLSKGQYKTIQFDKYKSMAYLRLRDDISSVDSESLVACDNLKEFDLPLKVVAFLNLDNVTMNAFSKDQFVEKLFSCLNFNNGAAKAAVNAQRISVSTQSVSIDSQKIIETEYQGHELSPAVIKYCIVSVDLAVKIIISTNCLTPCDDNNGYDNVPSGAANLPPIANAGPSVDLPDDFTTLDGTASYDPDGYIVSYLWAQLNGPASATIVTPDQAITDITGLFEGVYEFQLVVTDNSGAQSTSVVTVRVNPPATEDYVTFIAVVDGGSYGFPTNTISWAYLVYNGGLTSALGTGFQTYLDESANALLLRLNGLPPACGVTWTVDKVGNVFTITGKILKPALCTIDAIQILHLGVVIDTIPFTSDGVLGNKFISSYGFSASTFIFSGVDYMIKVPRDEGDMLSILKAARLAKKQLIVGLHREPRVNNIPTGALDVAACKAQIDAILTPAVLAENNGEIIIATLAGDEYQEDRFNGTYVPPADIDAIETYSRSKLNVKSVLRVKPTFYQGIGYVFTGAGVTHCIAQYANKQYDENVFLADESAASLVVNVGLVMSLNVHLFNDGGVQREMTDAEILFYGNIFLNGVQTNGLNFWTYFVLNGVGNLDDPSKHSNIITLRNFAHTLPALNPI